MPLSRRRFLAWSGALGATLTLPPPRSPDSPADPVADAYHHALLLHTRWVEEQWDAGTGAYRAADLGVASVLGNAVLLGADGYDPDLAGVDRTTLRRRTLATIRRFAATNRLAGGTGWGRRLFWDSTAELHLVLAARLLWAGLDQRTRTRIAAIASGQAAYAFGLAFAEDPLSGGRSPNGGFKIVESAVHAQAIAPGLAWGRNDAALRERFAFWAANASALPAADRANLARVDGVLVKDRSRARNLRDSFSADGDEAELWRFAGRSAIHFLTAGKPVPEVLLRPPNGEQLWRTRRLLAVDGGTTALPSDDSGRRELLALAFLAQVRGDRDAAWAEAELAGRLVPGLRAAPAYRLAKDAEHAEAETRAELAIAYLLHRYRKHPVTPVTRSQFFARAAGTRDFGADVGLTVQQSPDAFAAAATRAQSINLVWQPRHDSRLVDNRAAAFLPASTRNPSRVWTRAYQQVRDGVDATATVLTFGPNYAGYATLPTGTVVYASTGVGADEGTLTLLNPGRRTYSSATGSITLDGTGGGGGDGGVDELRFEPRAARYVRMQGRRSASQYGYSLWTFGVLDSAGADLAQGALPGASSSDVSFPAANATDGNPATRWAVDRTERGRQDAWIAVDLGSPVTVAGVRLRWEGAYATAYLIQTSTDAVTWSDAAVVPSAQEITGNWVDIDGRAGLVTHATGRPITVTATGVIAATGKPSPTLIEGYARPGVDLPALARRRIPRAPLGLRVTDADGYLSVFNFTPDMIAGATVTIPSTRRLYRGAQVVRKDGLAWTVAQPGGTARVEPPRFEVRGAAPIGTRYDVIDSHRVAVTAPLAHGVAIGLRSGSWSASVRLPAGGSRTLSVPGGPVTPTADLARGRTTFPTSPLPVGMTSPAAAVDGNTGTTWRPGPTGRMVVDLGSVQRIALLRLTWTGGRRPPIRVERSLDGVTYPTVARVRKPARMTEATVRTSARYVALIVDGWEPGDAELAELSVLG